MSAELIVVVIVSALVSGLVFGALGAWIASEKRRGEGEGLLLGLLFGPFGVLIEALLPTLSADEIAKRQENEKLRLLLARKEEEEIRRRAQEAAAERARWRKEVRQRLWKVRQRLWESTPDWARLALVGIIAGLAICLPLFIFWPSPYVSEPDHEATTATTEPAKVGVSDPGKEAERRAEVALEQDKRERAQRLQAEIVGREPAAPAPIPEEMDPQLQDILSLAQRHEVEGDLEAATVCYRVIIEEYPKTKQAREASEKLKTLAAVGAQDDAKKPVVVLDTSHGAITVELYPDKAPITVKNFLTYVHEGFYDNLIFHRVIPGFMVQGGGMDDQMREKPEKHAAIQNESRNGLTNWRGTIAMARTNNPHSGTCQFFINLKDNDFLDQGAGYAVFGRVIDGMSVVDAVAAVKTTNRGGHGDVPVNPIYIKSAKRKAK
jgi:peptidyl-prolyl cis-trans isomerase A (cyclophilin A)